MTSLSRRVRSQRANAAVPEEELWYYTATRLFFITSLLPSHLFQFPKIRKNRCNVIGPKSTTAETRFSSLVLLCYNISSDLLLCAFYILMSTTVTFLPRQINLNYAFVVNCWLDPKTLHIVRKNSNRASEVDRAGSQCTQSTTPVVQTWSHFRTNMSLLLGTAIISPFVRGAPTSKSHHPYRRLSL